MPWFQFIRNLVRLTGIGGGVPIYLSDAIKWKGDLVTLNEFWLKLIFY